MLYLLPSSKHSAALNMGSDAVEKPPLTWRNSEIPRTVCTGGDFGEPLYGKDHQSFSRQTLCSYSPGSWFRTGGGILIPSCLLSQWGHSSNRRLRTRSMSGQKRPWIIIIIISCKTIFYKSKDSWIDEVVSGFPHMIPPLWLSLWYVFLFGC